MEKWQLHTLNQVSDETNEFVRQLGGAIVGLKTCAALGQMDQIEVIPAEKEMIEDQQWEGQFVRIKLADKQVWLDPEEVLALIGLLKVSLKASEENFRS